ncbi:MAG TPA: DUF1967 domain-containing protein, partial [bacterium]|nr:DUF1967 domain-containing protein [bacterium]
YNIVKRAAKEPEYEKPSVVESSPRVMAIERLEKNLYRLHGGMIEKYIATLDFKVEETTEVFRQYMKRHRIEEFLKAKGVKEGDIVVIGDRDFVYKEE